MSTELKLYPAIKDSAGVPWLVDMPNSLKTGYEVRITRYFYKSQPMRTLDENWMDLLVLEKETDGLLGKIIGGSR